MENNLRKDWSNCDFIMSHECTQICKTGKVLISDSH
uniref:Uncharacterized protein n=1 Tax=Anguilla anguilla TaxID=7936 RepID=A0A0E9Q0J2_ANGAN